MKENTKPSVMQTLNLCQVERSTIHGIPTWRNISTSAKCNKDICKKYISTTDTTEFGDCFSEDDKLGVYNPTELLHKLCEIMIRFDANPKFYLKSDYSKLIELIKEILSSIIYTNNSNSFGGIIDNTTFNPTIDDEKKVYIPIVSGKFINFKDEEDNPFTITKEELVNSIIIFSAVVKENNRFFEKINIPINLLEITLQPTFRTARNYAKASREDTSISKTIIDNEMPDIDGNVLHVSDNLILFNLNVDKKWLKENLNDIVVNFYRVTNKKHKYRVLGSRNRSFSILNDLNVDSNNSYCWELEGYDILPIKLSECKIIINLDLNELIKASEADFDLFNEIWFVLPVSSYKFFRRLFTSHDSFATAIKEQEGICLSGLKVLFNWHPKNVHAYLHLKFPIGINFLYKVNDIKKSTDIEQFFVHFKRSSSLYNCYYSK